MTSDVEEWLSLAKSLIEHEKTCYEDTAGLHSLTPNAGKILQTLSLSLEATKAKGRRKDSLARLRELASKCRAVALGRLSRAELAACSRDLDSVISAIAELQKWDDFGEFSSEGVARFGSDLVNPLNRVAVYRGRFEPRLKVAETAIKSDALQVLKVIADLPAEFVHQTGGVELASATPIRTGEFIAASKTSTPEKPKVYLNSWAEILNALGLKDERASRDRIRKANKNFAGPIILPGQGGQPKVVEAELRVWWEGLEDNYKAEADERAAAFSNQSATVSNQFDQGREGHSETLVPEIGGHVKPRRRTST